MVVRLHGNVFACFRSHSGLKFYLRLYHTIMMPRRSKPRSRRRSRTRSPRPDRGDRLRQTHSGPSTVSGRICLRGPIRGSGASSSVGWAMRPRGWSSCSRSPTPPSNRLARRDESPRSLGRRLYAPKTQPKAKMQPVPRGSVAAYIVDETPAARENPREQTQRRLFLNSGRLLRSPWGWGQGR